MRIAIFTETFLPKWDGIANTLCYLLKHLERRGHACLMFAPEGAPETYAGAQIVGLPSVAFPFYKDLKIVPPLFDVAEQVESFRPDLIHLVNLASLGLVGMRIARDLQIPTVASYHSDFPRYVHHYGMPFLEESIWAYFRWLHNQADLNLCPSHYTRRQLVEHGYERVEIWGRGVDTGRYSPDHADPVWRRRLTAGEPDRQLLIYAGRLAAEKRIDWLRPLLDLLPRTSLALVGEGPMRAELEEIFEGTHTVFTGYLEGDDLAAAYASADLFVFPSASETFGNVVLEAMASGLPVVAAGAGGPVDHVKDGVNGYLSDPEDSKDFAALVWRCLVDEEELACLGRGARAYAETQTWEMILDGLLEQYARTIRKGPGNHGGSTLAARWKARHGDSQERERFRWRDR